MRDKERDWCEDLQKTKPSLDLTMRPRLYRQADKIASFEATRDSWLSGATTRATVRPNDAVKPSEKGSNVLV